MSNADKLILSIDDDQDILDYIETVLTAEGYRVATAHSAEDGLKAFKELAPDLVLVDLMMEEVDAGASFVKELRALGSGVPVYMLSSVGDALNMNTDYSQLGLKGVLQKPVDVKNLLRLVQRALGQG